MSTHYEELGVSEDAPYSLIKQRYRAALLAFHPDKKKKKNDDDPQHSHATFIKLQEAWDVLRDAASRAAYDTRLQALRAMVNARDAAIIWNDVSLDEMSAADDHGEGLAYYYPCKCGDCFAVSHEDLQQTGLVGSYHGSLDERMEEKGEQQDLETLKFEIRLEDLQQTGFVGSYPGSLDERMEAKGEQQDLETLNFEIRVEEHDDKQKRNAFEAERKVENMVKFLVVPCASCSLHIRLHL